jgi:hypothetical protein
MAVLWGNLREGGKDGETLFQKCNYVIQAFVWRSKNFYNYFLEVFQVDIKVYAPIEFLVL